MSKQLRTSHLLAAVAAACVLGLAAAPSLAGAPGATVGVFAEHYVLAGRSYDDLDALEQAVRAAQPRSIRLDACAAGSEDALRAAAHRFRDTYIELRTAGTDATVCATPRVALAVPASHRAGPKPYGIDHVAVDQWWHSLMP